MILYPFLSCGGVARLPPFFLVAFDYIWIVEASSVHHTIARISVYILRPHLPYNFPTVVFHDIWVHWCSYIHDSVTGVHINVARLYCDVVALRTVIINQLGVCYCW